LSNDILSSIGKHLRQLSDVNALLLERQNLMDAFQDCLKQNNMVQRINPIARFVMITNGEKLAAASSLWHYQNSLLESSFKGNQTQFHLLERSIETFMRSRGEPLKAYAALRQFFKAHVSLTSFL